MTEQIPRTAKIKVRTAAVAVGMNIVLTALKFLLYCFSGSLAILAEACHSFADIATSSLVLFAVKRPADDDDPGGPNRLELLVSLGIGLLLTVLAVALLKKFVQAEPLQVTNALISGFMFLLFSLGSYLVYRFETRIGEREGSIGLVSDGMHARADMTASLLTGFSLILYAAGLNLDRWVAGLIALFILSFAIETMVNVILVFVRRESDRLFSYRSFRIAAFLFDVSAFPQRMRALRAFLRSRPEQAPWMRAVRRLALYGPLVLLAAGYGATAVFSVGVRQQAVVERFGRPVDFEHPVGPGVHLKFPWPVDRVVRVDTIGIRELNIGNTTDRQTMALLWTRMHGTEEAFLSGDNTFFYPYIVLHYRISNIFHFLYTKTEPELLVSEVAHRVATALFAGQAFYRIAATQRSELEQLLFNQLQEELDRLHSGVELLSANFKDIHPPISVADSFERVIAGYQEKQKIINDALGYRNRVVPESRGNAAGMVQGAQAYITRRVTAAQGAATRFALALPASAQERQLAMSRIYLQTLSDALRDGTTIVVDPGAGVPELWMDFETMFPGGVKGGLER